MMSTHHFRPGKYKKDRNKKFPAKPELKLLAAFLEESPVSG
jgi:hypothetical protein